MGQRETRSHVDLLRGKKRRRAGRRGGKVAGGPPKCGKKESLLLLPGRFFSKIHAFSSLPPSVRCSRRGADGGGTPSAHTDQPDINHLEFLGGKRRNGWCLSRPADPAQKEGGEEEKERDDEEGSSSSWGCH